MMAISLRIAIVIVGFIALGGCSAGPWAVWETGSLMVTDKTLGDNIYSIYSGKNCSLVRYEKGLTYCEEDEVNPAPALYCYKTLGKINCYDEPDPYNMGAQRVDRNQHNYVNKSFTDEDSRQK